MGPRRFLPGLRHGCGVDRRQRPVRPGSTGGPICSTADGFVIVDQIVDGRHWTHGRSQRHASSRSNRTMPRASPGSASRARACAGSMRCRPTVPSNPPSSPAKSPFDAEDHVPGGAVTGNVAPHTGVALPAGLAHPVVASPRPMAKCTPTGRKGRSSTVLVVAAAGSTLSTEAGGPGPAVDLGRYRALRSADVHLAT